MWDVYRISTAWSTSCFGVFAISLISSMQIIKTMIRKDTRKSMNIHCGFSNKYIQMEIVSLTALVVINSVVFPLVKQFISSSYNYNISNKLTLKEIAITMAIYWLVFIANGVCFGASFVIGESISVELIPKHVSGAISGIKGMTRMFTKGLLCFVVGVLWDINYDWMWYIQGIQCGTALLIVISVACLESAGLFT